MGSLSTWIDSKFYPAHQDNWDDERLRAMVLSRLTPEMILLDIGAGAGRVKQMNFRGLARRVIGVDPDPRIRENVFLDEAHAATGNRLPLADCSVDLAFCDNVLEHLERPAEVLREVNRVLKAGGRFLAKTPNRAHYMPLIARLTPTDFHRLVNRWRGRAPADTFPTLYRANTPKDIRDLAAATGFEVVSILLIEGRPEYLRFNPLTYLAGWMYERLVNSTKLLARFRIVLLIELRKPTVS